MRPAEKMRRYFDAGAAGGWLVIGTVTAAVAAILIPIARRFRLVKRSS